MYSRHNPDPNLEWIETRLTPEGKVGQTGINVVDVDR
jgi:hypothetical protein